MTPTRPAVPTPLEWLLRPRRVLPQLLAPPGQLVHLASKIVATGSHPGIAAAPGVSGMSVERRGNRQALGYLFAYSIRG